MEEKTVYLTQMEYSMDLKDRETMWWIQEEMSILLNLLEMKNSLDYKNYLYFLYEQAHE